MHRDYLYWIWLSLRFRPGMGGFVEILEKFGSPYEAYAAGEKELNARLGADSPMIALLLDKNLSTAHRIYDFCTSFGVSILTYGDIAYPARLKTIQKPPLLLYYVGTLPAFNRMLCIGVVGTRRMSEYGKRMAYKISYELASAGAVVVSGMALGCDAVAAAGAIASGGKTVAVLGSGIDVIYPKQHMRLMEEIRKFGAVMTEYPPGTLPEGRNFPVRNRIISGLSQGSIAIEGDEKSGAMLTIAHAVKQGRKIFAVPGNVGEMGTAGTNDLIRSGATVALSAGDVLESFEVTDKELIDLDRYHRARAHSEPDEGLLFRLGISSRPQQHERSTARKEELLKDTDSRESFGKVSESDDKTGKRAIREDNISASAAEAKSAALISKKQKIEPSVVPGGDGSPEILSTLSARERKIFEEMPLDRAISIDRLSALGFSVGDIMTSMTILEIRGLVSSLPGGLYLKK